MNLVIKLAYGAAIAVLLTLVVVFGIRAAYEAPDEPQYPIAQYPIAQYPIPPRGVYPPEAVADEEMTRFEEEQRQYEEEWRQYQEDRQDYRRNVFLIAGLIGLGSMAAGVALAKRLDALRLGLILGGVATFIYSFSQAGEDIDDIGTTAILPVAAVGLVALLLLGYRRLAEGDESATQGS